jgi:hypothetical protein
MRSCLEPHTMGSSQPCALSVLSSPLSSGPLSRARDVSVTLLAYGFIIPLGDVPAGLSQDEPAGRCLQHLVAFSRPICRSEPQDFSSIHSSPSLGLLPGAWGRGRWQIVARAAAEVTRYRFLVQLGAGYALRGWASWTWLWQRAFRTSTTVQDLDP